MLSSLQRSGGTVVVELVVVIVPYINVSRMNGTKKDLPGLETHTRLELHLVLSSLERLGGTVVMVMESYYLYINISKVRRKKKQEKYTY